MREKTVEQYLTREVEKRGGLCLKFPPLYYAGFPDRLVLWKPGRIHFIETKRPGRTGSPLQRNVHNKLRALGFFVTELSSHGEVDDYLLCV